MMCYTVDEGLQGCNILQSVVLDSAMYAYAKDQFSCVDALCYVAKATGMTFNKRAVSEHTFM